jgi:hypothetical protein
MSRPEHFALTAQQLIASLKPQETDMTSTNQPADLDRLRRAHAAYDHGCDCDAHELAAEIPALIAEVERLRADHHTARAVAQSNRDKARILAAVVDAAYRHADALEQAGADVFAARLRADLDTANPA